MSNLDVRKQTEKCVLLFLHRCIRNLFGDDKQPPRKYVVKEFAPYIEYSMKPGLSSR
jgi:hypothetical protein